MNQRKWITVLAACASFGLSGTVSAQGEGKWLLRVGATRIMPHVSSGDLTAPSQPNTEANIGADTQLSGGITYVVDDHFAVDIPLALPFKHDLVGAGAISGVGKIGEVKALPFSVFGQYRFRDKSAIVRPYLGMGLVYAKFFKARSTSVLTAMTGGTPSNPTTLSVNSRFAWGPQIGVSMAVKEGWFVNGSVSKVFLKTRTKLSTGQTLDTTVNPTAVDLSVGFVY